MAPPLVGSDCFCTGATRAFVPLLALRVRGGTLAAAAEGTLAAAAEAGSAAAAGLPPEPEAVPVLAFCCRLFRHNGVFSHELRQRESMIVSLLT